MSEKMFCLGNPFHRWDVVATRHCVRVRVASVAYDVLLGL